MDIRQFRLVMLLLILVQCHLTYSGPSPTAKRYNRSTGNSMSGSHSAEDKSRRGSEQFNSSTVITSPTRKSSDGQKLGAMFADFERKLLSDLRSPTFDVVDALTEKATSNSELESLSPTQEIVLLSRLQDLYAMLAKNPERMMERRLHVGSRKPVTTSPPRRHELRRRRDTSSSTSSSSSSSSSAALMPGELGHDDLAYPSCPSRTEWKRLRWARDLNETEVEVYQPDHDTTTKGSQWFYTVNCHNHETGSRSPTRDCPGCCIGIDHKRFTSSCRQKHSSTLALVRRHGVTRYDWTWIQIPSSCNCAIGLLPLSSDDSSLQ